MKKLLFLGALLLSTVCMNAQTSEYYQEAANPIATNPTLFYFYLRNVSEFYIYV